MVCCQLCRHRCLAPHHRPPARANTATAASSYCCRWPGILGPVPQLLILLGNALTPGKGFREGPFATEAELRDAGRPGRSGSR